MTADHGPERRIDGTEKFQLRLNRTIWREVDDQIVVLDLDTSVYLNVGGPGVVIWKLLARSATLDELVDAVLEVFDVDRPTARRDLVTFLDDLAERKLLL
jgi:hypothetical protein